MQKNFLLRLVSLFLVLSFIISYQSVFAQGQTKVYKILGITVSGNKTADANAIISASGIKVNDEIQIPGDKTINAIKNLWALNIFKDVQLLIDKEIGDGIFLLIKVEEYPRFERIVFEGNDELSTSDLEKNVTFLRGTVIKPQDIAKLKQKIIKEYEKEGLLSVKIQEKFYNFFSADTTRDEIITRWRNEKDFSDEYEYRYDRGDTKYSDLISRIKDRVIIKFIIEEGEEVRVRKIEFIGNKAFEEGDLKGAMDEISEARWWKFWGSGKFDFENYKKDKQAIVKFYRKNGYRDAAIISDTLIYSNDKKDLTIRMEVYEGPQYKVRNINWVGNTVYPSSILAERLDMAKGDIFDAEKFEKNLRGNEKQTDVSSLYLDNGYLTFNLQPKEIKVAEDSVDIEIRIEERNQFTVNRVDIEGNDKTKEKVIRRELYTIPGDYFNRGLLLRSIQNLANLQYFNVEKLYGAEGIGTKLASDSTVDISFRVEEKSSDYLNASVGYSGAFGFSGAVGITLTNFSIAEPFRLGGGQILSFNWQFGVGSLYRTFTLGFTEPWLFDTPTSVGAEVFDTRQQYVYDLRQTGATIRVGRKLRWPDDFFYVQGRVKYQYNNVLEGQNFYAEGKTNQYTLGALIARKDIDNPIFPSIGSSIQLDAEISGGPFLPGDVDYLKIGFTSEWYRRLFNTNRVTLYTIADLGYIDEIVRGTKIQPFEFYYMGGNGLIIATTSLRGYDDRSVGPKNVDGRVIGGRVMAKFGTELRLAVSIEPIPLYVLAFAEAGNVFESFEKTDIFDLRRSVGFGARLLINPIGLIGFDLGYGFDRKAVNGNDPAWLFHFQFGKGF
ncbi:Outer membrane protein [Ignavibacterium album JCM 16511]|uniref:Outer membrane protein assembly factor BamA n=1 Tax=Ignavibacterium album (strain DSM 19864 / JCM 16511 / NBRC 101810 / Mat9-16) TaxID=945713 RepID=I0AGV2_IGNAJ|nr:outer membrane protein assembly factor BamA [Ignavibacterium album]AFH48209.1 Outer membrane protein [Ignavibacterium album JCM 16511]